MPGQVTMALDAAGFVVGVINPRRIRGYRAAEGIRAKTDRLDAGLIARFALAMRNTAPPAAQCRAPGPQGPCRPPPAAGREDRHGEDPSQAGLGTAASRRAIAPPSRRFWPSASTSRASSSGGLPATPPSAGDTNCSSRCPASGTSVATTLITELPELGSADGRAIASLAGLAPHPTQSGTSPVATRSAAGGLACAPPSTWRASPPAAAIPASRPPIRRAAPRASRPRSSSLPSRGSCWSLPIPSSARIGPMTPGFVAAPDDRG